MAARTQFQTAVVTGAASGIGNALCERLARTGSLVLASDIDAEQLEATAIAIRSSGGRIETAALDVADESAVSAYAGEVLEQHGAPDLLVNNAGIALSSRTWEMTVQDIDAIFRVNYWGVVHGTLAFLPAMRRRNHGCIVNLSSIFGIVGCPAMGAYASSKFAVRGFTECLRLELDLEGSEVRATCVHPGGVETNIVQTQRSGSLRETIPDHALVQAQFRKQAYTSPEAAARAILKAAAKGRRRVVIGIDARLLDWVQRWCPTLYQPLLLRLARPIAHLL